MSTCILCESFDLDLLLMKSAHFRQNQYYQCKICRLIFLDGKQRLSAEEERERYLLHESGAGDSRYRIFLSSVLESIKGGLDFQQRLLDYGAGRFSILRGFLAEEVMRYSLEIEEYDPFFNEHELKSGYDHIALIEVAEHFRDPRSEFARLAALLSNGKLCFIHIRTELTDKISSFEEWHYRRDPTHIVFYSTATFQWISSEFGLHLDFSNGTNCVRLRSSTSGCLA